MTSFVIGITGASGVVYGIRLLQILLEQKREVHLVISEAARLVINQELSLNLSSLSNKDLLVQELGIDSKLQDYLHIYSSKDFSAPIASGSYPVQAMAVIPCSMGSLGAISSGVNLNLIHRAADCMLKEKRPLILVPRETPLNAIHLENMLKLSKAGATILPAMPGFYSGCESVEAMVDFLVGKVLDQLGVKHFLYPRWTGLTKKQKLSKEPQC